MKRGGRIDNWDCWFAPVRIGLLGLLLPQSYRPSSRLSWLHSYRRGRCPDRRLDQTSGRDQRLRGLGAPLWAWLRHHSRREYATCLSGSSGRLVWVLTPLASSSSCWRVLRIMNLFQILLWLTPRSLEIDLLGRAFWSHKGKQCILYGVSAKSRGSGM